MPSISDNAARHTVIDRRPGHYLCFPDVCITKTGRLAVVYNEYDQHVATRRALVVRTSDDLGDTWSPVRLLRTDMSHCPRITALEDGHLVIGDDHGPTFLWSANNGETWAAHKGGGMAHGLIDRLIQLDTNTFLTTGHQHRGTHSHPAIRQAPPEQMVYISENRCRSWKALSVMTFLRNLTLCEASMCRMPDGRILSIQRENSFVYEPMYVCQSTDNGQTWSDPIPTGLIGHRPTMNLTPSGKLLVTYRNVGPDRGTCAWLGSEDELYGFRVHGYAPGNPENTADGLKVDSEEGPEQVVRYALRPMTDPRRAKARLEADIRVDEAGPNGVAMRLGVWWHILADRIVFDAPPAPDSEADKTIPSFVPLPTNRTNAIAVSYDGGLCRLFVNGREKAALPVPADNADTRPIIVGSPYPFEDNRVRCIWRRMRLHIDDPAWNTPYEWEWNAGDPLPDAAAANTILELKNDREANPGDFGYSGWVTLPDGSFYCVYHHGAGDEPGYSPGKSAHIIGTRFSEKDFA